MNACYSALDDEAALRRAAQRTLERAEKAVTKDADNGSAMASLFSALLILGETERAREWARRAVLIDPDNLGMRYNLACDLIVGLKDHDMALEMLEPVFGAGGREQMAWISADPDMDAIRDNPRFKELLTAAERRIATTNA
jgi:adenylate cyclase